jgi:DNA-binding MarR family transcriptional regulator
MQLLLMQRYFRKEVAVVTQDLDVLRLRAWTHFMLSYNEITRTLEREMIDKADLTLPQYDVLLRLSEVPGGRMKMSELAEAVVYSTGGLTRLFERMRRAGLVERERTDDDRRVVWAVLTEHGLTRLREASHVHLDGVARHFASMLPDEEAPTVAAFLARLHRAAKTCASDAG